MAAAVLNFCCDLLATYVPQKRMRIYLLDCGCNWNGYATFSLVFICVEALSVKAGQLYDFVMNFHK
jgi:hypothetical protein